MVEASYLEHQTVVEQAYVVAFKDFVVFIFVGFSKYFIIKYCFLIFIIIINIMLYIPKVCKIGWVGVSQKDLFDVINVHIWETRSEKRNMSYFMFIVILIIIKYINSTLFIAQIFIRNHMHSRRSLYHLKLVFTFIFKFT